ncbi:MAG: penicillin-insensitive murein endopeptidase [Alphaproteobacteria bacterium]|nr:penicillin-insensitive murein endopeptidase [Alphaproteobacteria bacterium]
MQPPTDFDSELLDVGEIELDDLEDEIRRRRRRPAFGRPRPPRPRPKPGKPDKPWVPPQPGMGKRPKPWLRWPRRLVIRRRAAAPCICPAHGTEFVRWVQSSLNQLEGLNLRINGMMNRATRNAVRKFQRQQGLPVDGIAGPDTEQALLQAKSGQARPGQQTELAFDRALLAPRAKAHPPHKGSCGCAKCRQQKEEGFVGGIFDWLDDLFGGDVDYPVKAGQDYGRKFGTKRPPGLPAGARKAGAPGSALKQVRSVAKAQKLGDAFVRTVVQMAKTESNGRYALPANTFNANPPKLRPKGQGLITAWGVFQYNRDAWTCLFSEAERKKRVSYRQHGKLGCSGCRGKGGCVFPWDATATEEVTKPIEQWAKLFAKVKGLGGSSRDAARAIRLFHISPTNTNKWLKAAAGSNVASAWRKTVSDRRRKRVDRFVAAVGITDTADELAAVFELDEGLELEFNATRAVSLNRKFEDTLGWGSYYFRIASELLGIHMFPIEETTFAEAVADWQKRNCFSSGGVDGIIGPQTWAEMSHLLGLKAVPTPIGPVPEVNALLPKSAPGYCAHKPQSRRYGLSETVTAIKEIARRWQRSHSDGTRIRVSDISKRGGGEFCPHVSHRIGIDVDLWLEDKKGKNILRRGSSSYSKDHAGELAEIISANPVLDVKLLLFWDKSASPDNINRDDKHHRHFHVRFCIPSRYGDMKLIKKAFSKRPNSTYKSCV